MRSLRYMISRINMGAQDRLFIVLWTGTTELGMSELLQIPGRASVTTLRPYRVKTLTHPRKRFKRQQVLLVFTGFML